MIRLPAASHAAFHLIPILIRGGTFAAVLLVALAGFTRVPTAGPLATPRAKNLLGD